MRNASKYTLLAVLTLAATSLAASSALAQTEPELHNQTPRLIVAQEVHAANDVACPAVTPSPPPAFAPTFTAGGCRLHVTSGGGAVPIVLHLPGGEAVISQCTMEFDIRIDAAGEGWMAHQELVGSPEVCTMRACGQPNPPNGEGRAYTFYMREGDSGPSEEAVFLWCLDNYQGTFQFHCELTVQFTQPSVHRYRFTAADVAGHGSGSRCELTGTFDVEATLGTTGEGQAEQNVEIRHT